MIDLVGVGVSRRPVGVHAGVGRVGRVAAALLVLAIAWALVFAFARQLYLNFDEAYNLDLARNLAARGVYATHLDDADRWFDPAVTTGPVVVLPAAAVIRLFGADPTALRAWFSLQCVVCALAIALAVRAVWGWPVALAYLPLLTLTLPLLFVGVHALGELPALAAAVAAICLFALAGDARRRPRSLPARGDGAPAGVPPPPGLAGPGRGRPVGLVLASGALLGVAVLAKDVAAFAVLAVAIVAVVRVGVVRDRAAWAGLLAPLVALAIVAGWRGVQYLVVAQLGLLAAWQAATMERLALMRTEVMWAPLQRVPEAFQAVLGAYEPLLPALALALLAWLLGVTQSVGLPTPATTRGDRGGAGGRSSGRRACEAGLGGGSGAGVGHGSVGRGSSHAGGTYPESCKGQVGGRANGTVEVARAVLAVAVVLWFGWFLLASGPQANVRHLVIGTALAELLVLDLIQRAVQAARRATAREPSGRPRLTRSAVAGLLVAVATASLLLLGWRGLDSTVRAFPALREAGANQRAVAAWIRQNTPSDAVLSGWGWYVPWHLAFLAHRSVSAVDLHAPDLEGLTEWLVLIPEQAIEGDDARLASFLAGRQPALEVGSYRVYRIQPPPSGPLRLVALYPHGTRAGQPFQVQPDGRSALAVAAEYATRDTVILVDGEQLATIFGGPTLLSATVPDRLFAEPGRHTVALRNRRGNSNALDFVVEP